MASTAAGSGTAAASGRKKSNTHRTLGSLLRHFVGQQLRVELKTGRTYSGQLESSEESLSLTLTDAVLLQQYSSSTNNPQPSSSVLSIVSIRGSLIRCIHFPDDLDLTLVVKQGLEREASARKKYQRVTRK
jgi:small nuclear ribonucleoprotein (snRNP)-like protein